MHVVVCIWITPVFLSTIGLTPVLHSHHKFLLISLFTSQTPDGAYAMTTTGRGGGRGAGFDSLSSLQLLPSRHSLT